MKFFLRLAKANSLILINAGSLIGTTGITSVLGFVYWWLAARLFSPEAVGLASADISAMTLLGTLAIVGLNTLLLGELPRQQGREISLISASLILVGALGGCLGIGYAIVAPLLSASFLVLRANPGNIILFAIGVSLTSITLVLDQACIGLFCGSLQLWRNILFATIKLAALFVISLLLSRVTGLMIYTTWIIGNLCSLVALAGFGSVRWGWPRRVWLPQWGLLRQLSSAALLHHALNLTLQAPALILPVMVTVLLSPMMNAWFYVSWTLSSFSNMVSVALTFTLYAVSTAQPALLARRIRLTLSLAFIACILISCVLLLGTKPALTLFGRTYAEQAGWSLRILALESFPFIIKSHYTILARIRNRVIHTTLLMIGTGLCELAGSALGAYLGGLTGLSLGWFAVMCVEAIFMSPTVYKAARFEERSQRKPEQQVAEVAAIWYVDTLELASVNLDAIDSSMSNDKKYLQQHERHENDLHLGPIRLKPFFLQDVGKPE